MSDRRIEQSVTIKATPEEVWHALTDAAELARWFPLSARVEPGPGGSIFTSWGGEWEGTVEITAWEPGKHLQTKWPTMNEGGPLVVDYFIESQQGETVLRLVHSGFGSGKSWDDEYDGINRGWKFELGGLRHYLEHHQGTDRRVAWARVPFKIGVEEAWKQVTGSDGLGLSFGAAGEPFKTADGLEGTTTINDAPRQFAGTVPALNNAYMRVLSEHCGGPDPLMYIWLSTYGIDQRVVDEHKARWQAMLDRILG